MTWVISFSHKAGIKNIIRFFSWVHEGGRTRFGEGECREDPSPHCKLRLQHGGWGRVGRKQRQREAVEFGHAVHSQ